MCSDHPLSRTSHRCPLPLSTDSDFACWLPAAPNSTAHAAHCASVSPHPAHHCTSSIAGHVSSWLLVRQLLQLLLWLARHWRHMRPARKQHNSSKLCTASCFCISILLGEHLVNNKPQAGRIPANVLCWKCQGINRHPRQHTPTRPPEHARSVCCRWHQASKGWQLRCQSLGPRQYPAGRAGKGLHRARSDQILRISRGPEARL